MRKLFCAFVFLAMTWACFGADKFIHQLPSHAATNTAYVPADIETSPGVWANYKLLVSDLRGSSTNFSGSIYTTNLYVFSNVVYAAYVTNITVYSNAYFMQTNFVNYNYSTNIEVKNFFVTSNAYFYATNFVTYDIVTNLTVVSNAYFWQTNYVNYEITTNLTVLSNAFFYQTNFVSYSYTTNLQVDVFNVTSNALFVTTNAYITNLTVNNVFQGNRAYITNLYVTNITYLQALVYTNAWTGGPTGTLDLSKSDQFYAAAGDMSVTGFINKSNDVVQNVLLTVLASGANRTIYYPDGLCDALGAASKVCTNGVATEIWFRYAPYNGGMTNVISQGFYR